MGSSGALVHLITPPLESEIINKQEEKKMELYHPSFTG